MRESYKNSNKAPKNYIIKYWVEGHFVHESVWAKFDKKKLLKGSCKFKKQKNFMSMVYGSKILNNLIHQKI